MCKYSDKKAKQLGMPPGTAANKLRKSILFKLLKESKQNFCFQCGAEIETEEELSIEHKVPYLDSEDPKKLFFDLDNIAFSHLFCNIGASRKTYAQCGMASKYDKGCRCTGCIEANRVKVSNFRERKKNRLDCSSKEEHLTDIQEVRVS